LLVLRKKKTPLGKRKRLTMWGVWGAGKKVLYKRDRSQQNVIKKKRRKGPWCGGFWPLGLKKKNSPTKKGCPLKNFVGDPC